MPMEMTERAKELLAALEANTEGWHSRAEIAALMGKKRLNPREIELLDIMADNDVIRRSKQDRGIQRAVVYRVKG